MTARSRDRWRLACLAMIVSSILCFSLSSHRPIDFDAGVLAATAAAACFLKQL
jgi:hypothetical protein